MVVTRSAARRNVTSREPGSDCQGDEKEVEDEIDATPVLRLGTPIPSSPTATPMKIATSTKTTKSTKTAKSKKTATSTKTESKTFRLFPRLPTELRFEIWRHCLPHRVLELDYLVPYHPRDKYWRYMYGPTNYNARAPPVIAHVCREARQVAFENWSVLRLPAKGHPAFWKSKLVSIPAGKLWFDRSRTTMINLNWAPCRRPRGVVDSAAPGNPIRHLAWVVAQTSPHNRVTVSISQAFLEDYWSHDGFQRRPWLRLLSPYHDEPVFKTIGSKDDLAELLRSTWPEELTVVMEGKFHLRTDAETAVASGLFGGFADSRVQIAHVDDKKRFAAFLAFAYAPGVDFSFEFDKERGYNLCDRYGFFTQQGQIKADLLRGVMFGECQKAPVFRTAYMFRLDSISEDADAIKQKKKDAIKGQRKSSIYTS
ncbi:hypothetical protein GE09DRAFT_770351 [Coniochaeta sp. 2T2.1]|nr:hypothetical protein GE09DRAFT_770351 [Coniochaeta sp. 2T2.1]